jgi:hypothetical protein
MALHTGAVESRDRDDFGTLVNRVKLPARPRDAVLYQ